MIKTRVFGEWFELTLPQHWTGASIEDILRTKWNAPKKLVHQLRMDKQIKVNDALEAWTNPLNNGDRLQLKLLSEKDFPVTPTYRDIEVLYEDEHLIVLNKPAHMDTHPNAPTEKTTLLNAAAYHLLLEGEAREIRHIHRLDRDTSGAILFAKHALAGAILDSMLEKRQIKRTYLALVQGKVRQKKGTIQEPIGRDRHHPTRRRVSPTGQSATTHYEVLSYFQKQNLTLLRCHLDTGRTHQIRVHLSHIGFPIAGDVLYGGEELFPRQALHAAQLTFIHPFTEQEISCHAQHIQETEIYRYLSGFLSE